MPAMTALMPSQQLCLLKWCCDALRGGWGSGGDMLTGDMLMGDMLTGDILT